MQPPHLLLASISATPLLMMGLWSGPPGQANTGHNPEDRPVLLTAPPNPNNRIWVRVVDRITLTGLASALKTPPSDLSRLNSVNLAHRFEPGDWVAMDAASADRVVEVMALDSAQIRRTPPAKQAPIPWPY